jgi:branched-chain amino acid transport system substrate-binding protein
MLQNKDILRLVFAVVIASGILGVGLWGLQQVATKNLENSVTNETPDKESPRISIYLDDRMSFGEKILVKKELFLDGSQAFTDAKEQGVKEMSEKKYQEAAGSFQKALSIAANAPETRIYLNNAEVGETEAYTIAVPVPIVPQKNGNEHPDKALEMLRGFAQAQTEINQAGGINGKRIKLLVIDDDDDPNIAKKIAEKLVKEKQIIGIMGHRISEVSIAAAPIYANGNLLLITPVSTSPELNREENSLNQSSRKRYVFRTNIDTEIAARKLATYVKDKFKDKKVAIFYDSQKPLYSNNLRQEFKDILVDVLNGKVVYESDLSASSENFFATEKIQEATKKGANIFMLIPNINSIENALSLIAAKPKANSNSQPIQFLGDISNLYRSSTLSLGDKAEGMVLAVSSQVSDQNKFYQQARKLWKDKINLAWQTATSYDAAQVFIEALKRNPDPKAMQEEICKKNFQAIAASGDPIKFDCEKSSSPVDKVRLVQVSAIDPSNSNTRYYFKLLHK